jgi:hypothetical protein
VKDRPALNSIKATVIERRLVRPMRMRALPTVTQPLGSSHLEQILEIGGEENINVKSPRLPIVILDVDALVTNCLPKKLCSFQEDCVAWNLIVFT